MVYYLKKIIGPGCEIHAKSHDRRATGIVPDPSFYTDYYRSRLSLHCERVPIHRKYTQKNYQKEEYVYILLTTFLKENIYKFQKIK